MTDWPDPARSGYPLNPERDGWHWLQNRKPNCAAYPVLWTAKGGWVWNAVGYMPNPDTAFRYRYLGPCLTPDEAAAAKIEAEKEGYAVAYDRLVDLRRELQFDPNSNNDQRWMQVGILTGIYYACKAIVGLAPPSKPFDA